MWRPGPHYMSCMEWWRNCSPRIFLCNGQPHQVHTKLWLSKCNFMTSNGLHENYVMSRKLIPQIFMYVMFLRGGVVSVACLSSLPQPNLGGLLMACVTYQPKWMTLKVWHASATARSAYQGVWLACLPWHGCCACLGRALSMIICKKPNHVEQHGHCHEHWWAGMSCPFELLSETAIEAHVHAKASADSWKSSSMISAAMAILASSSTAARS